MNPKQQQQIDTSVAFLLARTCKRFRVHVGARLEALGLHPGQDIILHHLAQQNGLTQSELAERTQVQPATMTRALQRMANSGLIERKACADDQRLQRVFLTRTGQDAAAAVASLWASFDAILFDGLMPSERDSLRKLLQQVYANLEAAN